MFEKDKQDVDRVGMDGTRSKGLQSTGRSSGGWRTIDWALGVNEFSQSIWVWPSSTVEEPVQTSICCLPLSRSVANCAY